MALCLAETGKVVESEHFWAYVEQGDPPSVDYAGPFTLDEAMGISWRVRYFQLQMALEARPSEVSPYEPQIDPINDTILVTQIVGAGARDGLPDETWYTTLFGGFDARTQYDNVSSRLAIMDRSPMFQNSFGFYLGASLSATGVSGTSILATRSDPSGFLLQPNVDFRVFGVQVPCYTEGTADAAQWQGSASITAFSYWPYFDSRTGLNTYDATTGAQINPIPLYMTL